MRVLMVTPRREANAIGGREQLSALHERCLVGLLGTDLTVRRLDPAPPTGPRAILGALDGRIDGVTVASEQAIANELGSGKFDALWLDGSNLGRLARIAKRARPQLETITFCHNVEARFFLGGLRHRPGPRALAVLAANFAAERLAVRHSDRLVALSERDSALLRRLYGRAASDLLPMAIDDAGAAADRGAAPGDGLLFVGGAFYANLAGMRWFAGKVAPRLAMRTKVVGRGFEAYRDELEASGTIDVIGGVADLAPWYAAARTVIAPIFDGSGMKTKVAEALMHGKPIIGTREAFSGYEAVAGQAGWRADTPTEWRQAIAALDAAPRCGFDPALRALFNAHFSVAAATARIAEILGFAR